MKGLLVLCNTPDLDAANRLGRQVVAENLAACVNILPACRSIYRWQGQIEEAEEIPLLIKTTDTAYPALEARLFELHPYEVPEIVAFSMDCGLPAYLSWLVEETTVTGANGDGK
jgi:periplasmic divalent cation tolerance protein